jgi:hypothetical protein
MHRARSLSAWLMLLAFAAGGLIGPAAHRVHHAAEHAPLAQAAQKGTCHSDAVHHAETPILVADAGAEAVLDCDLCATRHVVAPPPQVATPSPQLVPETWTAEAAQTAPSLFAARTVIRGPPRSS